MVRGRHRLRRGGSGGSRERRAGVRLDARTRVASRQAPQPGDGIRGARE